MNTQTNPILSCDGVSVRFGGVVALDKVDFHVQEHTITGVIGPNGAGKTTLFNAITGLINNVEGLIRLYGKEIGNFPPHDRGYAGIVRTFQNLEIFTNMTVLENVMTGYHRLIRYSFLDCLFKTKRYWREEKMCRDSALEMLAFVGLEDMADYPAAELPFGNQRLLELARALASKPDLLLLDEPAAGLNMRETRTLGNLITRIKKELDVTIVLVEHDMDLIMRVSDEIHVLSFGQVIAAGTPNQIQKDPEVISAYLGTEEEEPHAHIEKY